MSVRYAARETMLTALADLLRTVPRVRSRFIPTMPANDLARLPRSFDA